MLSPLLIFLRMYWVRYGLGVVDGGLMEEIINVIAMSDQRNALA